MSDQQHPRLPLTREELLAALDREISDTSAIHTSTGRTRWGMLLALATLVGFSLQAWQTATNSLQEVVVVAIAIATCWDFLRETLKLMDSWPGTPQTGAGRYFRLSELLGSARSALFVQGVRLLLYCGLALWLRSTYMRVVVAFYFIEGITMVIGWLASFTSKTFGFEPGAARRPIRAGMIFTVAFHGAAALSAALCLWSVRLDVHEPQLRLALILTSASYIVIWLAEENMPTGILTRLRGLRQDLAFNRITVLEASRRTDLFLTGYAATEALKRPFEEVSSAISAAQSGGDALSFAISRLELSCQQLTITPGLSDSYQHRASVVQEVTNVKTSVEDLERELKLLKKREAKFKSVLTVWSIFSPEAAKEAGPLMKKIEQTGASLERQMAQATECLKGADNCLNPKT